MTQNVHDIEQLSQIDPFADPTSAEDYSVFPELKVQVDGEPLEEEPETVESTAPTEHSSKTLFGPEVFQEIFDSVGKTKTVDMEDHDISDARKWELRLMRQLERRDPGEVIDAGDVETDLSNNLNDELTEYDPLEDEALKLIPPIEVDISEINGLMDIYDHLEKADGIAKQDVIALESMGVTLLKNPTDINAYSNFPSRNKYNASMETIGSRIKEMVREVIERIVNKCKQLMAWISGSTSINKLIEQDPKKLLDMRKEIIDAARKIDATSGTKSFLRFANAGDPAIDISTSTEMFVINHLNLAVKRGYSLRYTQGMRMINDGSGLASHIQLLGRECIDQAKAAAVIADLMVKNDMSNWGSIDTTVNPSTLKQLAKFWKVNDVGSTSDLMVNYRAAVQQAFRQPVGGAPTDYLKAANYANPFERYELINREVVSVLKNVNTQLDQLQKKANQLDAGRSYQIATGKLNEISRRLTMTQNLLSMYKTFHVFYTTYYQLSAQPAFVLGRKLKSFITAENIRSQLTFL